MVTRKGAILMTVRLKKIGKREEQRILRQMAPDPTADTPLAEAYSNADFANIAPNIRAVSNRGKAVHAITLGKSHLAQLGVKDGDFLYLEPDGRGRIVLRKATVGDFVRDHEARR
jgi:hypothetical protein